jgi:hypothetical protein
MSRAQQGVPPSRGHTPPSTSPASPRPSPRKLHDLHEVQRGPPPRSSTFGISSTAPSGRGPNRAQTATTKRPRCSPSAPRPPNGSQHCLDPSGGHTTAQQPQRFQVAGNNLGELRSRVLAKPASTNGNSLLCPVQRRFSTGERSVEHSRARQKARGFQPVAGNNLGDVQSRVLTKPAPTNGSSLLCPA